MADDRLQHLQLAVAELGGAVERVRGELASNVKDTQKALEFLQRYVMDPETGLVVAYHRTAAEVAELGAEYAALGALHGRVAYLEAAESKRVEDDKERQDNRRYHVRDIAIPLVSAVLGGLVVAGIDLLRGA